MVTLFHIDEKQMNLKTHLLQNLGWMSGDRPGELNLPDDQTPPTRRVITQVAIS